MAEKKIIKKADGTTVTASQASAKKGNATGLRIGAVIAWVFAIGFEVLAILPLFGKLNITFMNTLVFVILALVLDLGCVITGALLWKKSNRIDPASKKNKVKFWLWNNMGLIVCAFAFIPFVILALTNKEADKKTKTIAVVVAVIALLIGSLFGIDWNPISAEEKADAIAEFGEDSVYWTQFGTVYHSDTECGHLNHSDELIVGTVEQAIEANKTRLCKSCAAKLEKEAEAGEKDLPSGETEGEDNGENGETEAAE